MADKYTAQILRRHFLTHKNYVEGMRALRAETGISIRDPVMPEAISENIIKFIIHNHVGDTTSKWVGTGDLISENEGIQECKCFSSNGPASFGPTERWNVIYFLDARNWLQDHFELWRIPLKNISPEWRAIRLNATQTYGDQALQGRRPRINWDRLYPQISTHCTRVYSGNFEGIFIAPVATVQADLR